MNRAVPRRAELLARAKQRALNHVEAGELSQAAASMIKDLSGHPELAQSITVEITRRALELAMSGDPAKVSRWIKGFF